MPKLTKKIIESSLPKEKNYIVWDNEVKGFDHRSEAVFSSPI